MNFLLLSLITLASAEQFHLKAASKDKSVDGNTIAVLHEGAGINYAFATKAYQPAEFQLNGTSLNNVASGLPYTAQIYQAANNVLEVGVLGSSDKFSWDGDRLAVNGSAQGWHACKKIGDPYKYPQPAVAYFKNDDERASKLGCTPIELKKQ